jgi:hypothetical protein
VLQDLEFIIDTEYTNGIQHMRFNSFLLSSAAAIFLTQCSTGTSVWTYHYENGHTALLLKDQAVPPANIPEPVLKAIAAGNNLRSKPYIWGGGHGCCEDKGYDCSGATSYVLIKAGLLNETLVSKEFRHFGKSGEGKWITIYAKRGHAFLTVAGLRLDTQGEQGPRWTKDSRSLSGFRARHPAGW